MPKNDRQSVALRIGNGGWIAVTGLPKMRRWFIRAVEHNGELVIDEMYASGGITAGALSKFPVAGIVQKINEPEIAHRIRRKINRPGPDLHRAASYYSASAAGDVDANGRGHWCDEMLIAQLSADHRNCTEPDRGTADVSGARAPTPGLHQRVVKGVPRPPLGFERGSLIQHRRPSAKLDIPLLTPPDGYSPEFYAAVTRLRDELDTDARLNGRPVRGAQDIADANGISISRVNRWLHKFKKEMKGGDATGGRR